jgi:hypothetical protein
MDDTVVLVTVVAKNEVKPGQDFFPLTVDYQEKTYAAGRIPGGFFKREGRPIREGNSDLPPDRSPDPSAVPEGFFNEVQVIATVMSSNPEVDSRHPRDDRRLRRAGLSGMPFDGPIGAARVGYHQRRIRAEPDQYRAEGIGARPGRRRHREAVLMVESEAMSCPKTSCWARCVRPRADAGRDRRDQRAGRRSRQAALGLAAAAEDERDGRASRRWPKPGLQAAYASSRSRRAWQRSKRFAATRPSPELAPPNGHRRRQRR